MSQDFLPHHGGYKKLRVYKVTEIIYDMTYCPTSPTDKKGSVVLLILLFLLPLAAKAQLSLGVRGGYNLTHLSLTSDDIKTNRYGFFVGPALCINLPIVGLGLDAAALYDQREAEIEGQTNNTEKIKSQSIQVPINLRYEIGLGESANIFIFAGPQFGFNIGDKTKSLSALQDDAKEWTLSSSNISANVGLGVTLMTHLQLSANYNIALGKTGEVEAKDVSSGIWDAVNGKANSWQIALAYYF